MSADPLELLFAQLNKELHDKMGMCFSDRYAVQEILKPILKTYGEQCAFNAIHPKCTCSKCTGRPDYEDIQDDIDKLMKRRAIPDDQTRF